MNFFNINLVFYKCKCKSKYIYTLNIIVIINKFLNLCQLSVS